MKAKVIVLNLIINGLPSILRKYCKFSLKDITCFKPYYKWITFNTLDEHFDAYTEGFCVLNLIINGLPSIP